MPDYPTRADRKKMRKAYRHEDCNCEGDIEELLNVIEELEGYTSHKTDCASLIPGQPCSCGLTELLGGSN